MLVIGIDPGTAITGYGLVASHHDQLTLVAHGAVTTPAGMPLQRRLQVLYGGLADVIAANRPDEAAVEELFFSRNARTALSVGHGRGVALLALANADLPIAEYKPSQIKQAITGYGQAGKAQMQEMVKLLLDLPAVPRPDDAADAIAVAICHIHSARFARITQA